ncbi:MAG: sugar transferase [Polyangiaceae bacterium]|nr:sugar transferase [Polyangiaceae bacterium]
MPNSPRSPSTAPTELARRAFDISFALIGCNIFAPFFLIASALIKLDDGGPVLFRQERVGRGRRRFSILKFRTMRKGKVTRVGAWLRATGLDETAQFLNVLRGDMSMVGPRPLTQADIERLGWTRKEHDSRWDVNPGITGLAQLFGPKFARGTLRFDKLYAAKRSAWLDTQLIAASFVVNIVGKQRTRGWLWKLRAVRRRTAMIYFKRNR